MDATRRPAKRFDSLQQEAYLTLWRTYDRLRAIEDDLFTRWNLTAQQYNLLRLLRAAHPEPVPTLKLVARLVSRSPDITRMIDKLEAAGLISRVRSTTDRRAVLIGITTAGQTLLDQIAEPLRECHEHQLGHMHKSDLQALVKLLNQVREPLEPDVHPWH